jgi:Xaa-Pro aminopeptidase
MALHFAREEFDRRKQKTIEELKSRGLDGLLMFRQESMYYLTGYSLGTTFAPNWMDWPMFYHGNPVLAEPNMVFFLHMILMDSDCNNAMCFGHTVVVTDTECESLSKRSLELVIR